jgi:hypothetical protein
MNSASSRPAFSQRPHVKVFVHLTEDEVARIEASYAEAFSG